MKCAALLLLLSLSVAAEDGFKEVRDPALARVVYMPRKIPYAKTHRGLLKLDMWSLKLYPYIVVSSDGSGPKLRMAGQVSGPQVNNLAFLTASVDGKVAGPEMISYEERTGSGSCTNLLNCWAAWDDAVTDPIVRGLAHSHDVYITLTSNPNGGDRCSFKLTPQQLQLFQRVIEKYDSLATATQQLAQRPEELAAFSASPRAKVNESLVTPDASRGSSDSMPIDALGLIVTTRGDPSGAEIVEIP